MKRLARVLVVPIVALSLTACSSVGGIFGKAFGSSAEDISLDGLKNLPSGRVIQYQERLKEAEKQGQEAHDNVLYLAAAEDGIIGQTLTLENDILDQETAGATLTFKEDGTIDVSKPLADTLGNPTHWQMGVTTLRVCWEPSCKYYASWSVRPDLSSWTSMRYNLYLEGLTEDERAVTLELSGERRAPFNGAVVPFDNYEPPVYKTELPF